MARKSQRRQYGTGSVYLRRDGMWVGTLEAGWTERGTRRRITVSARTEAECKRRLRDKRLQIDRDGAPASGAARTTLKAWAPTWLGIVVHEVRPHAYDGYASSVRRWVVPTLGHKRLDSLTPGDVRALDNAQRAAGRSASTIRHTRIVLNLMLRAAIQEGHSVPQRVLAVRMPSKAVNDRQAFTAPEAIAVLEEASKLPHGSRWAAAFLQGIRQAECLGLTWDHVDLTEGWLDISWQLKSLPYANRRAGTFRVPDGFEAGRLEGAYHLVRPKTARGQRIVPLVPWMVEALRRWREAAPQSPHGLVWSALDGRPANSREDLAEFKALQSAAGVGHPSGRYYVTHEARHTTATLLMELGVEQSVITAILGHSSIVTSRGYMHATPASARTALTRVADRLQIPTP